MRTALVALALQGCFPTTGEWTPMSDVGAPRMRTDAATVWTGSEVVLWGGYIQKEQFGCLMGANNVRTGARYDPAADTWAPLPLEGAPEATSGASMWWTGTYALVWTQMGGAERPYLHRYDPDADAWTAGADPEDLLEHDPTYHPVWIGDELFVWAPGYDAAAYDPATDSWRAISSFGERGDDRDSQRAWTGTDVLLWSNSPYGTKEQEIFYRYTPATDTWTDLGTKGGPVESLSWDLPAYWSGEELVILEEVGRGRPWHYDPQADSWSVGPIGPNIGGKIAFMDDGIASWAADTRGVFYEPATGDWWKAARKRRPKALGLPAMQWTGDALMVWGGGSPNPCDEVEGEGGGLWRP